MKYTISAVKRTILPTKAGGTWTKLEVRTQETGEQIFELGNGIAKNVKENLKAGVIIEGYVEDRAWTGRDGQTRYNKVLNGITIEYLYNLMKKLHPEIEGMVVQSTPPPTVTKTEGQWVTGIPNETTSTFDSSSITYPDSPNPDDIPW